MTTHELDRMVQEADDGVLDYVEMVVLIRELAVYRQMALRLEKAVHELVKENEKRYIRLFDPGCNKSYIETETATRQEDGE